MLSNAQDYLHVAKGRDWSQKLVDSWQFFSPDGSENPTLFSVDCSVQLE